MFGLPTLFLPWESGRFRQIRTRTRTRSYFVWCLPGGCCLHRGHSVSRVGGHSQLHSYLHSNRQFSGARPHWVRNQCADISISAILESKGVGIAAVTVRIHSLSGIAPAPHIIKHDTGAIYGCRSNNYYLLYRHRNDLDAAFFLCDEFTSSV